jgi:hypothetical protein
MSSIQNRTDDAQLLWDSGRHEGAFLAMLIAVAAASRRRYPTQKDRERFERFLRDCRSVRLNVEYRGECHEIEHIFYKWLRCELVHEGALPVDIQFMREGEPGSMSVRAGGAPEYVLKIGHGWFHHMVASVTSSPEVADGSAITK